MPTIANLNVTVFNGHDANKIIYMLSPVGSLKEYFSRKAPHIGITVVVIDGMDWDNDLTPWPAPGEPKGCPPFQGLAPQFLSKLVDEVIPQTEKQIGMSNPERTLIGVSLSGLFALWQWTQCNVFKNIISISGSFWYDNFAHWFDTETLPSDKGRAYFSLGTLEPQSKVPAFRCVGSRTEQVVARLRHAGIQADFEWTQGTHFAPIEPRLDQALKWLIDVDE